MVAGDRNAPPKSNAVELEAGENLNADELEVESGDARKLLNLDELAVGESGVVLATGGVRSTSIQK